VSCVRIMCWLINTHRLSALFGWAPGSARRAQRHWKPHKYVREKERDIEWGSRGDRVLAEPTQHYLNSRAVCVYATCSMENSSPRPTVAGVWSWSHWRGSPLSPPPAKLMCSYTASSVARAWFSKERSSDQELPGWFCRV